MGNSETAAVSPEANQFFAKYDKSGKNLSEKIYNVSNYKGGFDNFIKQANLTDKSLIEFLNNINYTKKDLASYQQYLANTSNSMSNLTKTTQNANSVLNSFGSSLKETAIEWVINKLIEGAEKLELKEEIAAENATGMAASLQEFHNSFTTGSQKIQELSLRYDELSRGVSSMGNNLSLSSEQYTEYKNIVSELSELMPNLNILFNEQGEKIGFAGGKLKNASKEYQKYEQSNAQELLRNGNENGKTYQDILDDFQFSNETDTYGWSNGWRDTVGGLLKGVSIAYPLIENISSVIDGGSEVDWGSELFGATEEYSEHEQKDVLQKLVNAKPEEWSSLLNDSSVGDSKEANLVEELLNIDVDEVADMDEDTFNHLHDTLLQKIKVLNQSLEVKAGNVTSGMPDMLHADDDYWEIQDSDTRNSLSNILSSMGYESLQSLGIDLDNQLDIETWVANFVDKVKSNENNVQEAIKNLFALDTELLNPQTAKELTNQYITTIANAMHDGSATKEQIDALKKTLGFDDIDQNAETFQTTLDSYFNANTKQKVQVRNRNGEVVSYRYGEVYNNKRADELNNWASSNNVTQEELEQLKSQGYNSKSSIADLTDALNIYRKKQNENPKSSLSNAWDSTGTAGTNQQTAQETKVDQEKQLSQMKTGITAITSGYNEKKKNRTTSNVVGTNTLNSIHSTLGVSEWNSDEQEVWENYQKVAGDSSSSIKQLKAAQDELATSFVNSNNFLSNLNDENVSYYTGLLKEMGITNATSVVVDTLRQNKANLAIETYNSLDAESKNADELNKVKEKLQGCTKKEREYYFSKLLVNSENISTEEDKKQLADLADDLDISCQMVDALKGKLLNINGTTAKATVKVQYHTESGTSNDINGYNANTDANTSGSMAGKNNQYFANSAKRTETKSKAQLLAEQNIKDLQKNIKPSVQISKDGKSDDKKSNTKISQTSKTELDWIERRITRLTAKISLLNAQKENLFSIKKKNSNLNKQIAQTTKLINAYKAAISTYTKKANGVKFSKSETTKYGDLKKAVREGRIKGNTKDLVATYGKKTANKIQKYQDYYDKAQATKQSLADAKTNNRALTEKQYQNYVDLYDSRTSRARAKEDISVGAAAQNKAVDTQIKNTKLSYDYQIKIANLTDDKVKIEQLMHEKEKAITDLKKQQLENLKTEYENRISLIDNNQQDDNNKLSQMESRGQIIQSSYYSSLNNYENQKLSRLNSELADLQDKDKQGIFVEHSQEWYGLQSDIQSVKNEINDAETAIIENNKKIGELRQAMYDDIAWRNSNVSTEANFLAGLLGDNLTNEKTGDFTKEGLAVLGTYGIDMETNSNTAQSRKTEREEIEKNIADYKKGNSHALDAYGSFETAEKKLAEVIQQQQDALSAEYANEKQIYDLMAQKYQSQLSYLKSIMDAKKQVLDMEKDLYDYQKNIASQTKNIASLEKQLAALQGDNSEEGRARKSKIQLQLDEANEALQDTEYERYISDQQNMLDNLYTQYEDLIQELEKNFEEVVEEGVTIMNSVSAEISATLSNYADTYGYKPSNDMHTVLDTLSSIDQNGNAIKTLPETITTGLSNIGAILQAAAQTIVEAYNPPGNNSDVTNSSNNHYTSKRSEGEAKAAADSSKYYEDKKRVDESLKGTTQQLPKDYSNIIVSGIKAGQSNTEKVETPAQKNKAIQTAVSYINAHLSAAKKKKSEYSDVNQVFYSKWKKRVLNESELKALASKVGVTYDNATKTGHLYKRLKALGLSGFKRGGIGRLVKASGEDGFALVRNGEGFIAPEHVESIQSLMNIIPDMTQFTNTLTHVEPVSRELSNQFGDIVINAELPNVANVQDFVQALQHDRKTQQALTIATKDLMEKGRITNRIQNIQ